MQRRGVAASLVLRLFLLRVDEAEAGDEREVAVGTHCGRQAEGQVCRVSGKEGAGVVKPRGFTNKDGSCRVTQLVGAEVAFRSPLLEPPLPPPPPATTTLLLSNTVVGRLFQSFVMV